MFIPVGNILLLIPLKYQIGHMYSVNTQYGFVKMVLVGDSFTAFGEVASFAIIKDMFPGESRGFGFVEMPNKDEADKVISAEQIALMAALMKAMRTARLPLRPSGPIICPTKLLPTGFRVIDTCPGPGYPNFVRGRGNFELEASRSRAA